jgi:hypothetical protein
MSDHFLVLRFPLPKDVKKAGPSKDQIDLIVKMAQALAPQMGFPSHATPTAYDRQANAYPQFTGTHFTIDVPYLQQNIKRLLFERSNNTDATTIIIKTTKPLPITVTPTYADGIPLTYPMLQRGFIPTLLDTQLKSAPVIVFAMQSPDSPAHYNHYTQDVGIFRGLPQPAAPDSKDSHIHTPLTTQTGTNPLHNRICKWRNALIICAIDKYNTRLRHNCVSPFHKMATQCLNVIATDFIYIWHIPNNAVTKYRR